MHGSAGDRPTSGMKRTFPLPETKPPRPDPPQMSAPYSGKSYITGPFPPEVEQSIFAAANQAAADAQMTDLKSRRLYGEDHVAHTDQDLADMMHPVSQEDILRDSGYVASAPDNDIDSFTGNHFASPIEEGPGRRHRGPLPPTSHDRGGEKNKRGESGIRDRKIQDIAADDLNQTRTRGILVFYVRFLI